MSVVSVSSPIENLAGSTSEHSKASRIHEVGDGKALGRGMSNKLEKGIVEWQKA